MEPTDPDSITPRCRVSEGIDRRALAQDNADRAGEVTALRVRNGLMFLGALIAMAAVAGSLACGGGAPSPGSSASPGASPTSSAAFAIEEATIDGIHAAIRSGQTTCQAIVQAYIDRARAYNGVCTSLVTADGADIPPATGAVRAGTPLTFPTKTTKSRPSSLTSINTVASRSTSDGWSGPYRTPRHGAGRYARRHSQRGTAECAGDAQHPWRAVSHL